MATYKLATYQSDNGPCAGAVLGDAIHSVAALTGNAAYATVLDVLSDWDAAHNAIEAAAIAPKTVGQPVSSVKLMAPVPNPGAIYCVGSNYRDHAEEMRIANGRPPEPDLRERGHKPWFFIKSSRSVAHPGAVVRIDGYSAQLDWEIELVAIVGRKARGLCVENALSCIAGYTVGNDLSARDLKQRDYMAPGSLFRADWLRHKSFDNSAPMGPWMTPAVYIEDPADLAMKLWVNDALKQNSNSGNMIFSAAEQIAELSVGITLHPGDMIMTGTPAGVGAGKNEYLHAGDVVKMQIAEIGTMDFEIA